MVKKICDYCGKEFNSNHHKKRFCCKDCEYQSRLSKGHSIICLNCGKVVQTKSARKKFCCNDCQEIYESKIKFKDVEDVIICKDCGMMGLNLLKHIGTKHSSIEEYCEKHKCKRDELIAESSHKTLQERQKRLIEEGKIIGFTSENNPSKGKECKSGRNSPYSMNFRGYDGLTDEEKQIKINNLFNKKIKSTNDNCNNPKKIEYYLSRGLTEDKALEELTKSQSTFSLEKCIEKYGEEEGRKRWVERQEKWLKNFPKNNYSKVSQELFDTIIDHIENYNDIYYATNKNGEYTLKTNNYIYKLDFYIKSLKKVIEFDGDYWHNQNKPGNKARDEKKSKDIINSGLQLLRVKERDYNKDPDKVLEECLKFINSK